MKEKKKLQESGFKITMLTRETNYLKIKLKKIKDRLANSEKTKDLQISVLVQ